MLRHTATEQHLEAYKTRYIDSSLQGFWLEL